MEAVLRLRRIQEKTKEEGRHTRRNRKRARRRDIGPNLKANIHQEPEHLVADLELRVP